MVRCKMLCNTLAQRSHGNGHVGIQIELGAVYSNDPQSENKSFADATPTASLKMDISPGRPAAAYFQIGKEYYVDIHEAPPQTRFYVKDKLPPFGAPVKVQLENSDGTEYVNATWVCDPNKTHDGKFVLETGEEFEWRYGADKMIAAGWSYWSKAE